MVGAEMVGADVELAVGMAAAPSWGLFWGGIAVRSEACRASDTCALRGAASQGSGRPFVYIYIYIYVSQYFSAVCSASRISFCSSATTWGGFE